MTREDFKRYRGLPAEKKDLEERIKRLERKAGEVPIVKDKVLSSQDEWPYLEMHLTVDAPEPRRNQGIQRELRRYRWRLAEVERLLDELTQLLLRIEDSRTRQILTARYVDGLKLKDVALKYDMTEQWALRIIREEIKKL